MKTKHRFSEQDLSPFQKGRHCFLKYVIKGADSDDIFIGEISEIHFEKSVNGLIDVICLRMSWLTRIHSAVSISDKNGSSNFVWHAIPNTYVTDYKLRFECPELKKHGTSDLTFCVNNEEVQISSDAADLAALAAHIKSEVQN